MEKRQLASVPDSVNIMNVHVSCPLCHPVLVAEEKLGDAVICPHCGLSFLAELLHSSTHHARDDAKRGRRSRDEDDDEDEEDDEDRPRKKSKSRDDDEEDDEDRPRRKSKSRDDDDEDDEDDRPKKKSRRDDDDEEDESDRKKKVKDKKSRKDEDEDEEDDEEDEDDEENDEKEGDADAKKEEPEEPIEWTPRKRQLNLAANAVIVLEISCYMMMAFSVLSAVAIILFELVDDPKSPWIGSAILNYVCVPIAYLVLAAIMISMVMDFWAPSRVQGGVAIIASLVFGGAILVIGIVLILALFGVLTSDVARQTNFVTLLVGASIICFMLSAVSAMAYVSRLFVFMRLNMEASQPVTNLGFIFMCFAGLLADAYGSKAMKEMLGDWMKYPIGIIAFAPAGLNVYLLVLHVFLLQKLRQVIAKYIREA